jgi:hypothetical protein
MIRVTVFPFPKNKRWRAWLCREGSGITEGSICTKDYPTEKEAGIAGRELAEKLEWSITKILKSGYL